VSDLAKLLDVLGRDPVERLSINRLDGGCFKSVIVPVGSAARWVPDPAKDWWYGTAALHPRVASGRGYAKDVVGVREVSADLDVKRRPIDEVCSCPLGKSILSPLSPLPGFT
jgi:hypothetical protein